MSTNNTHLLLRSNLKHLRLPTMQAEPEKLTREAVAANEGSEQYLLRLTELEVASFSRAGAELLFQVFADRDERKSLPVTSNLAFSEWSQVFQGERMTALLDRLTHRCHTIRGEHLSQLHPFGAL
jgi:hypothetical protein